MANGSDGVHPVRRHIDPLDGSSAGHAPDRSGFIHGEGDPIGTVDGGGVVCPMLIEVAEGCGLNCEHHLVCLLDLIIEPQMLRLPFLVDGLAYCPLWGSDGME